MESAASPSRPPVTIVNGARRAVEVVVYKRSPLRPDQPPIAWQVVPLPPRGKTTIVLPREYQVCARYSFEPDNPRRPVHQTNVLKVPQAPAGAGFVVEGVSPDRRIWGAVLTRTTETPGWYQIRVVNRFPIGVWGHLRQEGRDVVPPRILPPLATWTEDLSSPFYLAVLALPYSAGDLLQDSEIARTEIAVQAGENVKVQGGPRKGFEISRIPEGRPRPPAGRRRCASNHHRPTRPRSPGPRQPRLFEV